LKNEQIEVEVKVKLKSKEQAYELLRRIGARFISSRIEKDIYFNHPNRDFKQTGEVLRLRKVDGRNLLTYKAIKSSLFKSRTEIEVEVSDYNLTLELLRRLGFVPIAHIFKERETYQADILGKTVNFLLDDVKGLGTFLEIEVLCNEVREGEKILNDIIKKLNLKEVITKSYLEMFLAKSNKYALVPQSHEKNNQDARE